MDSKIGYISGILVGNMMKYSLLFFLVLTGCYTSRKLENSLPVSATEFPEKKFLTYSSISTIDSSDAYSRLVFQTRGFLFPRNDSVGPKQLQFYYDGDKNLQVMVSDSPNKHIKDFKLYVKKKSGNHLILRPKFNCVPFFPFLIFVQRQLMVLEMLDDGSLIFLDRNYFFLSSPILNFSDATFEQLLLKPGKDSI